MIHKLASHDPNERIRAQIRLTEIGKPAFDILVQMTTKPEIDLRREAAAVLGEMRDPSAIPALINLLVDEAFEVRWRAAESLIKMGTTLVPLFQELLKKEQFGSIWFLDSVHHILRKLDKGVSCSTITESTRSFQKFDEGNRNTKSCRKSTENYLRLHRNS